jgi:hypothetical protein
MAIGSPQTGQLVPTGAFAGNIHAANYASGPPPLIEEGDLGYPYGSWYAVPDDSVKARRTSWLPFVASFDFVWTLPNGTQILLDPSEIRWTDGSVWDYETVENVSVRCTENTIPGLLAFRLISSPALPQVREAINRDRNIREENRRNESSRPTTQSAVIASANTILIVVVVFAAVWFLPKNVAR